MYDPYAELQPEKEEAIRDIKYAYNLARSCSSEYSSYWASVYIRGVISRAINVLLRGCRIYEHSRRGEHDVMYYGLKAMIDNHDFAAVRQKVNDWHGGVVRPSHRLIRERRTISKYVPGDHYYPEGYDVKFGTREEAESFLKRRGYDVGELIEKHVYRDSGG